MIQRETFTLTLSVTLMRLISQAIKLTHTLNTKIQLRLVIMNAHYMSILVLTSQCVYLTGQDLFLQQLLINPQNRLYQMVILLLLFKTMITQVFN